MKRSWGVPVPGSGLQRVQKCSPTNSGLPNLQGTPRVPNLTAPNPKQCSTRQVPDHVTGHVGLLGITGLNTTFPIPTDE